MNTLLITFAGSFAAYAAVRLVAKAVRLDPTLESLAQWVRDVFSIDRGPDVEASISL